MISCHQRERGKERERDRGREIERECVCVCAGGGEREREIERDRERDRERERGRESEILFDGGEERSGDGCGGNLGRPRLGTEAARKGPNWDRGWEDEFPPAMRTRKRYPEDLGKGA